MAHTQLSMIESYLKDGHTITPIEALNLFGCFRLGARIWDLKNMGLDIVTEIVTDGRKRWAKYRLKS